MKPCTTVKLYKEDVELMKENGKYGETLADICHRLFEKANITREEISEGCQKATSA